MVNVCSTNGLLQHIFPGKQCVGYPVPSLHLGIPEEHAGRRVEGEIDVKPRLPSVTSHPHPIMSPVRKTRRKAGRRTRRL